MERDADGFLLNTSDWSPEIMEEMAEKDGFEITDQIKTYMNLASLGKLKIKSFFNFNFRNPRKKLLFNKKKILKYSRTFCNVPTFNVYLNSK